MTNQDYFDLNLPRWPMMLVRGESVTVNQAKEIIFRTDGFLTNPYKSSGGNNKSFNEHYRNISSLEKLQDESEWNREYVLTVELRRRLGIIRTDYVFNSWASCSYYLGPHGWCHPDGTILFGENVGKYPTVEDVYLDWVKIATAFPFLNLSVTLFDREWCEENPKAVCGLVVKDGQVAFQPTQDTVLGIRQDISIEDRMRYDYDTELEIGLPREWYDEFADQVKEQVEEILQLDWKTLDFDEEYD